MAEKLGEIGDILVGLCNAVKTMKTVRQKSTELYSVTENTKKHAMEVDKIDLPGDAKLDELKHVLKSVLSSASKLEVWLTNFGSEINELERFLKEKICGSSIPNHVLMEFCEKLKKMNSMASSFSKAFTEFADNLSKAQRLATELEDEHKKKAEAKNKEASSKRNWGAAGTVGLIAGGVGIVALGFFTGGAAWAIAGAAAGTAVAGAGVAVGYKTSVDVKAMREMASNILSGATKLNTLAKELKSSCDQAGKINLDKEALEALQTALEFFRRDLNKDERIAQQQMDLDDKDQEIAALRAQLKAKASVTH